MNKITAILLVTLGFWMNNNQASAPTAQDIEYNVARLSADLKLEAVLERCFSPESERKLLMLACRYYKQSSETNNTPEAVESSEQQVSARTGAAAACITPNATHVREKK